MAVPKDPTITVKITVPYGDMKKAQQLSIKMVEACQAAADHPSKKAVVRFVKVEG